MPGKPETVPAGDAAAGTEELHSSAASIQSLSGVGSVPALNTLLTPPSQSSLEDDVSRQGGEKVKGKVRLEKCLANFGWKRDTNARARFNT